MNVHCSDRKHNREETGEESVVGRKEKESKVVFLVSVL